MALCKTCGKSIEKNAVGRWVHSATIIKTHPATPQKDAR